MAVQVKGKYRDLWAFLSQPLERRRRIRRASSGSLPPDSLLRLTTALHPQRLELTIAEMHQETPLARTFKLVPVGTDAEGRLQRLPPFRAGQYLSLEFVVQGVRVSRPYSICCSPTEARQGNFYELTVRRRKDGFVAPHIWEQWRPGTQVLSSGPLGQFGYEPLRDRRDLVFLAGGCGITPFRSLWRELRSGHPGISCTILYGAAGSEEFIFRQELEALAAEHPDRFRVYLVAAEPDPGWEGLTGLLTGERIRELAGNGSDKTFYVCGPPGLYRFLQEELEPFDLPPGALRQEPCGEPEDVSAHPGYPRELADSVFTVKVHRGDGICSIPARASESVLIALERAGLAPPAQCRSGQCGYCRSRILDGRVYVLPGSDGRREADRKFGHFHPCSSYPLTDLEIRVPAHPLALEAEQREIKNF
jgi:ferredoxin-NADP reductase